MICSTERGYQDKTSSAGEERGIDTPKITALCNTPVQGTAADITKKALALLPQGLADTGAQIIGMVHDEIILEVPEGVADDAAAILKETMIQAGRA